MHRSDENVIKMFRQSKTVNEAYYVEILWQKKPVGLEQPPPPLFIRYDSQ